MLRSVAGLLVSTFPASKDCLLCMCFRCLRMLWQRCWCPLTTKPVQRLALSRCTLEGPAVAFQLLQF